MISHALTTHASFGPRRLPPTLRGFRRLGVLVASAAVVFAVAACSSEEDPFATTSSFCTALAEAECKNLAAVCGAAEDACKQARQTTCTTAATSASNQGREYRPNAAQPCIDRVNQVYGEKVVDPVKELEVAEVCERVFGGSKQKNESCANTFECSGAMVCDRGVCADEALTSRGSACNNPGQVCETGSYCQPQGANNFCVENNGEGDTCSAESPCVETLRCVGTCQAKVNPGGACESDADCSPQASHCDPTEKKCRPKYQAGTSVCKDYGSTL